MQPLTKRLLGMPMNIHHRHSSTFVYLAKKNLASPPRIVAESCQRTDCSFRAKSILILSGAERDRTADLMLAKHALSQLSYCPKTLKSWAQVDLNHSPPRYQHGALPAELWALRNNRFKLTLNASQDVPIEPLSPRQRSLAGGPK